MESSNSGHESLRESPASTSPPRESPSSQARPGSPDPADVAHALDRVIDTLVNQTDAAIPRTKLKKIVYRSYDELAAQATITSFLPILTARRAMERIRESGLLERQQQKEKPTILVIDEHNSARSQTAAALFRFYAPGRFTVQSAGIHPSAQDDPIVAGNLALRGVELTDAPKPMTDDMLADADHLIVIGDVDQNALSSADVDAELWTIPTMHGISDQELAGAFKLIDDQVRQVLRQIDPAHKILDPVT
ncbi:hypothetical protein N9D66_01865 [Candidatus Nanopelagicales bacterium]|nr:hypothetical protein [Candidatus Nanopelagicales bacterium]